MFPLNLKLEDMSSVLGVHHSETLFQLTFDVLKQKRTLPVPKCHLLFLL